MSKNSFRASVRIGTNINDEYEILLRSSFDGVCHLASLQKKETRSGEIFWVIEVGRAIRPEVFDERLISLGYEIAELIGNITQVYGCNTIVSFCQEIDDIENLQQSGVVFSPKLVQWSALARASIEIDQYLYLD